MPPPPSRLPRGFIGSSGEGHHIAELLQLGLDSHAECTVWSQGVFGLSGGTLQSLCDSAKTFDFAILVLTPDDLVQKRNNLKRAPRDNVLFELGLFMGALGREATFIVSCANDQIELPSDLAGITTVPWRKRSDGNLQAALGPACTRIRLAIEGLRGDSPPPASSGTETPATELDELRNLIRAQSHDIKMLVETISRGTGLKASASPGDSSSERLSFLEGTWRNWEVGSFAYARLIDGVPRFPYCYGGNDSLTGEYYDIVRAGDILTGKFRWFIDPLVRGCVYLRIKSQNELEGGWWYSKDLSIEALRQHPNITGGSVPIQGMVSLRWVRDRPGKIPGWVEEYYEAVRKAIPR